MKILGKIREWGILRLSFFILTALIITILIVVDKRIIYSEICMQETYLSNVWLLIPGLLVIFCVCKWILGKIHFGRKYLFLALGILGIAVLFLQIVISAKIYFVAGWDCSIVTGSAADIAAGRSKIGDFYYYSQYPNNIMLVFLLGVIQKLAYVVNISNYYACVAVGCILVNLSGIVMALCVEKLTENAGATLFSFLTFSALVALSPWITIPYSDVFGMLFPILAFYFYLLSAGCTTKAYLVYYFCIGLSALFGALIKPTCMVVLIAIVLIEGKKAIFVKKYKIRFLGLLGMTAAAGAIVAAIRAYAVYWTGCILNDDLAISMFHYLMMGMNQETVGCYSSADYGFTSSFPTRAERMRGNLAEVGSRLKEMGFLGYMELLLKKLLLNFNDGTFSWWMEGGFLLQEIPGELTWLKLFLRRIYYPTGDLFKYFTTAMQTVWIAVQVMMLGMAVPARLPGDKRDGESVLILSLIGMFAFVMLFEARARYLLCYAPMYILCGIFGLTKFWRYLSARREKTA